MKMLTISTFASSAASTSDVFARARQQILALSPSFVILRMVSSSSFDTTGNPASMISTPTSSSFHAISIFSCSVKAIPAALV